ncbi:hypothetical protein JaAD80_18200 [Janthinobacterium sp. AD80]|nr:hypothetical protein JaAD80_18200 [Janthinobacterium sp. AD80]
MAPGGSALAGQSMRVIMSGARRVPRGKSTCATATLLLTGAAWAWTQRRATRVAASATTRASTISAMARLCFMQFS